jgi:hypothetical protein
MIVLLLLLLNDDGLGELKDFLHSTYKIKADGQHLELMFLDVMPLLSINSKVFIDEMIPVFQGVPYFPRDSDLRQSHIWNTFV